MQKMNTSFLANTSISATGYKINIGEKIENIIILFVFISLIKINNNTKYKATIAIWKIRIVSLKLILKVLAINIHISPIMPLFVNPPE